MFIELQLPEGVICLNANQILWIQPSGEELYSPANVRLIDGRFLYTKERYDLLRDIYLNVNSLDYIAEQIEEGLEKIAKVIADR